MKVINLTPHTINVCDESGNIIQSFPSAGLARAESFEITVNPEEEVPGVRVVRQVFGAVTGLPESQPGTIYLVSMVVGQALQSAGCSRRDIYGPNTSPGSAVRDANGQIRGVKCFVKYC